MKCQGNFVFKSVEHVEAGEFKNSAGDLIKYPGSYRLSVDEVQPDGKINDVKNSNLLINHNMKFKIPETAVDLVNQLRMFKPYEKISLECSVNFYSNGIRVIPEKVQKLDK